MKAAIFTGVGEDLVIDEVQLATPKRNEVLVRTAYAGLCHSDLSYMVGAFQHPLPAVLGHESSGVVEAVGEDVRHVKPGDHVVTCPSVFCGHCPECLTGHPYMCEDTAVKLQPGMSRRLSYKGGVVHQFHNMSSFAEQMLVHENALVRIKDDIPLGLAVLLGCATMTGVGAVLNTAAIEPGARVAVIGCGGVGLSCVNGAALGSAERIIAIDTQPEKLAAAIKMGATDTVLAGNGDIVQQVREMTGGGVEHAFECLGSKGTVEQAFAMLRPRGTATVIGAIPVGVKIELAGVDFLRERRIQGSLMGSNRFRIDIPRYLEFWRQDRLHLDHLVSRRMKLDEINDGFAAMKAGKQLRQSVEFPM